MFEGHVSVIDAAVVRLSTGTWRYHDEGLAFTSLADAQAFVASQPSAAPFSPATDEPVTRH